MAKRAHFVIESLPSFADTTAIPVLPTTVDLYALAACVMKEHHLIDARLSKPAKWRGLMRRERNGTVRPGEKPRYVQAYDRLTRSVSSNPDWVLDADTLRTIHQELDGNWQFRDIELRVAGGSHIFPPRSSVPGLIDDLLGRLAQSTDPAPLKATRAHLALCTIHPFRDGNGRTARLVASLILVTEGFRSTLLTSVEQHFDMDPFEYIPLLDSFRYGEIEESVCIAGLLRAMIRNAMHAAWFRSRELRIRARCAALGLEPDWESTLTAYDLGQNQDAITCPSNLWSVATKGETPLHVLIQGLSIRERSRLSTQLRRLLDEELDDSLAPDP